VFFQPRPGTTLETVLYFHPIAPIALPARKAMAGTPIDVPLSIVFGLIVLGLLIVALRFFIKAKPLIVERMLLGGR
jgi:ABC-type polysaccharide/polyol phosphate export permease